MLQVSLFEIVYPLTLLLAAAGYCGVLNLRPQLRSARWFALAVPVSGAVQAFDFADLLRPTPGAADA